MNLLLHITFSTGEVTKLVHFPEGYSVKEREYWYLQKAKELYRDAMHAQGLLPPRLPL